jgi:hypothetical protein
MVIVKENLYREQAARQVVRSLGVSEARVRASERVNPGLDWLAFTYALDRVFLSHGGAIGQVTFLRSPSQTLDGRTPLEAITEPDGPRRICRAARAFSTSGD